MITLAEHSYGEGEDSLTIWIYEMMKEDYGLYVWPCAISLAEYVWQQRHRFTGSTVIEFSLISWGAGTSLPGIVAAKIGAKVTLTDSKHNPQVFENMQKTCKRNNVECEIQALTWGEWDENIFNIQHPRFILGADVLYDNKDFDDLFGTVSFLLANDPQATFITTYESRSGHRSIEFLMAKWNLYFTKLMDVCHFMSSNSISSSSSVLLAEIKVQQ